MRPATPAELQESTPMSPIWGLQLQFQSKGRVLTDSPPAVESCLPGSVTGRLEPGGHLSLEMIRRYVSMANGQRSLIDWRVSPMDVIAGSGQLSRNARRLQPKWNRRFGG